MEIVNTFVQLFSPAFTDSSLRTIRRAESVIAGNIVVDNYAIVWHTGCTMMIEHGTEHANTKAMKTNKTAEASPALCGKHTPTPWHYYYNRITDSAAIGSDGTKPSFAKVKGIQNATFIVRACNVHDELVNALELAEATIERLHRHAPGSAVGTLDVIEAALATAKGGRS